MAKDIKNLYSRPNSFFVSLKSNIIIAESLCFESYPAQSYLDHSSTLEEPLHINQKKPNLHKQRESFPLKLFISCKFKGLHGMTYFHLSSMRPPPAIYPLLLRYLYLSFPFRTLTCYAILGTLVILFCNSILSMQLKLFHYIL